MLGTSAEQQPTFQERSDLVLPGLQQVAHALHSQVLLLGCALSDMPGVLIIGDCMHNDVLAEVPSKHWCRRCTACQQVQREAFAGTLRPDLTQPALSIAPPYAHAT